MNNRIFRTTRVVSEDWLTEDIPKGTVLYEFTGVTYGCISPDGIACSVYEGENPFMEIPIDALEEI
jgi:hypothetical protein